MAFSARELTLVLRVQSAGTSNIRRLSGDLRQLERGGQSFGQKFQSASRAIGAAGRAMQLVGGIGTAALGLAANSAANLQSQVTLAATQVANSTSKVRQVATTDFNGILKLMGQFPQKSDDMAKALYDLYSTLNIKAPQGLPLLQVLDKAATAGAISATDAGNGLLSVMSNFKEIPQTAAGATTAFNRMFAAVRYGRINMAQFSTSLATTAPAAKIAGQSLNDMAGTVAFLSRSLGPSKASVGYSRLVEVLSGPQMQKGLKAVGVNIDGANGKMLQLDQVIGILTKKFPYLTKGGIAATNFFKTIGGLSSTIQARRAFATLVKDVGGYNTILGKTVNDNNEFNKSFKAMYASQGTQWAIFLNTLKSIVLTIGATVIPAFIAMSKPLRDAVKWFQNLSPAVQKTIGTVLAFSAVGLLVVGTLLTVVAAIGGAAAGFAALGGAIEIVAVGFAAYGAFATLALNIFKNWSQLKGLFGDIGKHLLEMGKAFVEVGKAVLHGDWSKAWSSLGTAITAAIPAIMDALNVLKISVINWFKGLFGGSLISDIVKGGLIAMFMKAKLAPALGFGAKAGGALAKGDMMMSLADAAGFSFGATGLSALGATAGTKAEDIAKAQEKATAANNKLRERLAAFKSGVTHNVATLQSSPAEMKASKGLLAADLYANGTLLDPKVRKQLELQVAEAERTMPKLGKRMATAWGTALNPKRIYQTGATKIANDLMKNQSVLTDTQLAASNLKRNAAGDIIRQTGQYASSAEKMALAQATVNAEMSKGAVFATGASVAIQDLGTAAARTAGGGLKKFSTGILSTIGLGSPLAGGLVVAAGAVYGLDKAAHALFPSMQETISGQKASIEAFKSSTDATAQASASYTTYSQNVTDLNGAIKNTQKVLSNTKGGTSAYRHQLSLLAQEQNALKTATDGAATAQTAFSDSIATVMTSLNDAKFKQSIDLYNSIKSGSTKVVSPQQYLQGQTSSAFGSTDKTIDPVTAKAAADNVKMLTAALSSQIDVFAQAEASGRKLTASEKALMSVIGSTASSAGLGGVSAELAGISGNASTLLASLGRVPQGLAGFGAYANSIQKNVIPAVKTFMKITGQAPNPAFVTLLTRLEEKAKGAGKEMAAFVGTFGRLPNKKEINLGFHRPEYVRKFITDTLLKLHRMPTKKEITIVIKAHNEAAADLRALDKKLSALQLKARDLLAHRGGTVPSGLTQQIQAAQAKIANTKVPPLKGIAKFTVQGDFTAVPQEAKVSAHNAVQQFKDMPAGIAKFGTAAGVGFSQAFSATAHATANATIDVLIKQFKVKAVIASPSKLFKKEIGDPILQGILAPLKDKKSMNDAANTATDNMVSAFQTLKDTFAGQFGDLFTGVNSQGVNNLTDKINWGEKLNFADLQKNLKEQTYTFAKFQHGLHNLAKKPGAAPAFIQMLQNLGPGSQAELTALLNATPGQLRKYVHMWEKSQKLINNTAKGAMHTQVRMWRSQGEAVALGFMSGMQAHEAGMARYFRQLFLTLFKNVKGVHKSHSPSKLYMQEGKNVAMGFQMGVKQGLQPLALSPPVGVWKPGGAQVASVTNNYSRTYNVYPQKEENLLSALRKYDMVTRNHP